MEHGWYPDGLLERPLFAFFATASLEPWWEVPALDTLAFGHGSRMLVSAKAGPRPSDIVAILQESQFNPATWGAPDARMHEAARRVLVLERQYDQPAFLFVGTIFNHAEHGIHMERVADARTGCAGLPEACRTPGVRDAYLSCLQDDLKEFGLP